MKNATVTAIAPSPSPSLGPLLSPKAVWMSRLSPRMWLPTAVSSKVFVSIVITVASAAAMLIRNHVNRNDAAAGGVIFAAFNSVWLTS